MSRNSLPPERPHEHSVQQVCGACLGRRSVSRTYDRMLEVIDGRHITVRDQEWVDCETCDGEGWVWTHG